MKTIGGTVLLAALIASGCWMSQAHQGTPSESNQPFINLAQSGKHEQAMDQARELMRQLQAQGWDKSKVDPALLRLPEQDFAEKALARNPQRPSFAVTCSDDPSGIYRNEVAFKCDLYVRWNVQPSSDVEGRHAHPEGFFIVGWKDGRVVQVPIGDVRLKSVDVPMSAVASKFERIQLPVFPGMSVYDPALPKYPGL